MSSNVANVLVLPGDGIGPEIVTPTVEVLNRLSASSDLALNLEEGLLGGAAIDAVGAPLPDVTLSSARAADAVLMGSIGGPKWDHIERELRPERGLLRLRSELGLFANLRPAMLFPELADASTLRPEVVAGLDILIIRELTGGIYFGQPRGIDTTSEGERRGFNTLVYTESEIERIVRVACESARKRNGRVCYVDKANVLEVSELWREIATRVGEDYPDVEMTHMYVDNAAMQLVRDPKQFDVIVTGNMFGDILSDLASMLTGSIGMLPSASLDKDGKGLYEPSHGSAPDIAGQDKANPLATILSCAMMLRYSLGRPDLADQVERAVSSVLGRGLRTADIAAAGGSPIGTAELGQAVVDAL